MPLQLNVQFDIVIYSLLSGIITGILFDAYRMIRGGNIPKAILFLEDILFWFLSTIVVFTFLLYTNYAFLGPYVYVFIIIALALYFKLVSPLVMKVEKRMFNAVNTTLRVSGKAFIYPIKIFLSKMGSKNK